MVQRFPDHPAMLFDRVADPGQDDNSISSQLQTVRRVRQLLSRELESLYCPADQHRADGLEELICIDHKSSVILSGCGQG